MRKTIKIEDDFNLTVQKVNQEKTITAPKNVNHIFVVDVSGSMHYDLPLIRKQLKNKLPSLLNENDTITIIWFSGKNEAGILKEEVEVKTLKTLDDLNNAIDRWLVPIGLTAFLKPLELVGEVIERVKSNRTDSVFNLLFFTDGYNNNCNWNDVIETLKKLENSIQASSFIEYGFYADSQKLTQMATILGGEKVSCDNFDDYDPIFCKKLTTPIMGGKKVVVEIKDSIYDFAYTVTSNGDVLMYNISDGKIQVAQDIEKICYFSEKEFTNIDDVEDEYVYAGIYVLSDNMMNFEAEKLFSLIGDVYYYKQLVNAYGKQKLNEFKTNIKNCVINGGVRYKEGKTTIVSPDDNVYCLMNLMDDLTKTENCLFFPNDENFIYNRIGRKKKAKGSELSETDKKRLSEAKNIDEANVILNELKEKNIDLKFVDNNPLSGYPITDFVWNESRANLSIRVKFDGKVILPENKFGLASIDSFKYRTFTIIKDGIVNIENLPVSWSPELLGILNKNSVNYEIKSSIPIDNLEDIEEFLDPRTEIKIIINLNSLPIINRGMVKSISAESLAKQEWELLKLQAENKVYKHFKNDLYPKTSESYITTLGLTEDCVNWLKEIGITDYNGFAPKTLFEESTDVYMSVNLNTKIKGLSSIPKVTDVIKKLESGKDLKLNEWILSQSIINYNKQQESEIYQSLDDEKKKEVLKSYLTKKTNELNQKKRSVMQKIAELKFSLILSKKWFNEFKGFDENVLNLTIDNQELQFTFDLSEKEELV
jgi:hypothetical protein